MVGIIVRIIEEVIFEKNNVTTVSSLRLNEIIDQYKDTLYDEVCDSLKALSIEVTSEFDNKEIK